ncbi:MAG: flagellar biosynthesis protein FlhB [Anaerolineaceae bacterium]|nr:flagellar biosynthesis protein FlhB [Anaerolineaceae bacterium]
MAGDKTEDPTPRRLQDARAKGQVARSMELNAAIAVLGAAWLMQIAGGDLIAALQNIMVGLIKGLPDFELTVVWYREFAAEYLVGILMPLGIIILGMMFIGVSVTLAQIGLKVSNERKFFDFDRVNPVSGFKRLFSLNGLVQLLKSLLKIVVIGWVAYSYLQGNIDQLLNLSQIALNDSVKIMVDLGLGLFWRVGSAYLILAIADYIYQRWEFMRKMRMSKQEIKEEIKQMEGDPYMRGRIRAQQRAIMAQRMMSQVPQADVIITNPTHLANAVKYDDAQMEAPVVVAKGKLLIAEKIIEIAEENEIPVVQNIPLAHSIFGNVEVDQSIPPDMYLAMAEVLAYVYKLKEKKLK